MNAKYFIKKFLLFIIPLILVFGFLELRMRKIPTSYEAKKAFFEKAVDSIEVLALGNSHMLHGINPTYFSAKGFNLASGFQTFFYDKELTIKYLDRLKKLKIVFISADYISFYYGIKDVADWIDYGYYHAWGIRYPELGKWDSRNYSTFMLYTPANSFGYFLKGDNLGLSRNIKPDGFNPENPASDSNAISDLSGKMRAQYHTKIINFNRQKESITNLEALITELKKRNIQVVLLAPPVFATYSKFLDSNIVKRTDTIIAGIISKYNCLYKNYSSDKRFDRIDFHDNDHLNYNGAEKFTRILDDEFVKPLLSNQTTK
jgi:hypothetical protein